jgi:hypothetical protein
MHIGGFLMACINTTAFDRCELNITKVKGIGSIFFLKNVLKKNCRKNYKRHFKRDNYEVYTAVARCFLDVLDVIVLENIK